MSANSDVKLVNGQVVVDAWDLCVDSPDRRKKDTPHRRALVHDFEDGLTVNWGNDYPGGVKLNAVRAITKDPNFLTPVTLIGGLHVKDGAISLFGGNKITFSDADPSDDWATGAIHQDDSGLQISGGVINRGADQKPVRIIAPVATKTLNFGELPAESANRIRSRARSSGGPARTGMITISAGSSLSNSRAVRVTNAPVPIEFDIFDTFLDILEELTELRERIEALEAKVNS